MSEMKNNFPETESKNSDLSIKIKEIISKFSGEIKEFKNQITSDYLKKLFAGALVAVLTFGGGKTEAAVYIEENPNDFSNYLSYIEKKYSKVIDIKNIDVNNLEKQAEIVVNNLSEEEKKFVWILLLYPKKAKQYRLSSAKNLANKLIVSKLFPEQVQLSGQEKQQIQKYASKIQENINIDDSQLKEKLTILFTLQFIKQILEKQYFDVQYKKTKLWYIVKQIKPKIESDFLIKIYVPIKLASKKKDRNTEIIQNLFWHKDIRFWSRLNPNIHIFPKWTIILVSNSEDNDLSNLTVAYWNNKNKKIEQENKKIEQENKFIEKDLNDFLNWSALYPWTSIDLHKKQWDFMYNLVIKDTQKVERIISILKKRNQLDIEADNLQKAANITLYKLSSDSPQDMLEYSRKIKKVCEIFWEISKKSIRCELNINPNKNANTARNPK